MCGAKMSISLVHPGFISREQNNMNDIVPLSKLGQECGVDYFVVKPCSDTFDSRLNSPKGEYIEALDIFKDIETITDDKKIILLKIKKHILYQKI